VLGAVLIPFVEHVATPSLKWVRGLFSGAKANRPAKR
jgi:hypothetical protein